MSKRNSIFTFFVFFITLPMFSQNVVYQSINDGWQFKQVRGHRWYSATVPGVIHTDLLHHQLIEDPFFRLNERSVQWVDKEDWEYKIHFSTEPQLLDKQHIELKFFGLDTYADVYLNNRLILQADNMFRSWCLDVKSLLRADSNELRVYFHSPLKIDIPKFDSLDFQYESGNDQSENGGVFDKKVGIFARKAGYHYGWDWGPRLVTSGIWRPVELAGWDDIRIENVQYVQENVTAKKATINAVVQFRAERAGEVEVGVRVAGIDERWTTTISVDSGQQRVTIPITIKQPRLWWCNGLGEAYRYAFTTTLTMNRQSDEKTEQIGLRDLQVIREKDAWGTSFAFRLNGVDVFMKGANYIPQHSFLTEVTDSMYQRTILDAVAANMNMLRVWGGGIYENDIFYDLCDQYGILVWQDFMFACALYPTEGALMENVRQEAIENVIRLRNHPCIALWCGNNENSAAWFGWGYKRKYEAMSNGIAEKIWNQFYDCFFVVLPEVVAQNDTRFYWPSSPYNGDPFSKPESGLPEWNPNGDGHYWGVWQGLSPIAGFDQYRCRFMSEYGFQSFPEYASVLQYAPDSIDHDIFSEVMMSHQRGGSTANQRIKDFLRNEYHQPKTFEHTLYLGQILQGDAIKRAIEAHRRDMPYCMGSLFWQHNDCWPVASWSSRDFYGRWKAQHYFARKAFNELLVSPTTHADSIAIVIVSDRLKPVKGSLTINVLDFSGNTIYNTTQRITLPPNAAQTHFDAPISQLLQNHPRNEVILEARFTETGTENAITNHLFFASHSEITFPKATITTRLEPTTNGFLITLESDYFARGVFLSLRDTDNFFSDNYFDLLPRQPQTITLTTHLSQSEVEQQLKILSMGETY